MAGIDNKSQYLVPDNTIIQSTDDMWDLGLIMPNDASFISHLTRQTSKCRYLINGPYKPSQQENW